MLGLFIYPLLLCLVSFQAGKWWERRKRRRNLRITLQKVAEIGGYPD